MLIMAQMTIFYIALGYIYTFTYVVHNNYEQNFSKFVSILCFIDSFTCFLAYDCGMYTICFIETICDFYKKKQQVPLELHVEPETITKKRKEIKELINSLMDKWAQIYVKTYERSQCHKDIDCANHSMNLIKWSDLVQS